MSSPTQLSLTSWTPPVARSDAPEQARQAVRVGRGIDEDVMAVAAEFVGRGPFHLGPFTAAVLARLKAKGDERAPDSPRRRLHALMGAGWVQGECVDRNRSLWRIDGVSR